MLDLSRRSLVTSAVLAALLAANGSAALAAGSTKDIVLDRVAAPAAAAPAAGATATSDAMAVSVLVEAADGTLTPRGTDKMFRTGDRFRVKVLASRDAKIALYNTNPKGVLGKDPVWQGEVKLGQETITPRLRLDGNSGVDYLHIVMQPAKEEGIFAWLGNWLSRTKDGSTKDISLDVQNTDSATYLLNGKGQGLVTTMRIVHQR
jgi:hypothetical protein